MPTHPPAETVTEGEGQVKLPGVDQRLDEPFSCGGAIMVVLQYVEQFDGSPTLSLLDQGHR